MLRCALLVTIVGIFNFAEIEARAFAPFDDCADTTTPASQRLQYGTRHVTASIISASSDPAVVGSTNRYDVWQTDLGDIPQNDPDDPEYQFYLCGAADLGKIVYYQCGAYTAPNDASPTFNCPGITLFAANVNAYLTNGTLSGDVASIVEDHTGTSYGVTIVHTNETSSWTESVSAELGDPYVVSTDINHGQDEGEKCDCDGMPQWFVTEPYFNLWVKDRPVFYHTSLGEKLGFELAYKQHDTRPKNTTVPPTGWSHNWFSYVHFIVPTYMSATNVGAGPGVAMPGSTGSIGIRSQWRFTNDFSQWQAILYSPQNGENYFDHHSRNETRSGLQLMPLDGVDAHVYPLAAENPAGSSVTQGFRLVHPDGSVDIYSLVSSPKFSLGIVKNEGGIYDTLTDEPGVYALGQRAHISVGTNHYASSPPDEDSLLGQQMGYVACDALLTRRIDPYGNEITLNYNAAAPYYLQSIVDYDSQTTTLAYNPSGMLTNVAMPYGRSASLTYANGLLAGITDAENLTSGFAYAELPYTRYYHDQRSTSQTNIYLAALNTPYGTTSFEHYEAGPFITVSNPLSIHITSGGASAVMHAHGVSPVYTGWYGGTNRLNKSLKVNHPDGTHELYVYRYDSSKLVATTYPSAEVPHADLSNVDDGDDSGADPDSPFDHLLSSRNTFHWNRQQYPLLSTSTFQNLTTNDLAVATMKHWLRNGTITQTLYPQAQANTLSSQLSLQREASPDRVREGAKTWFDYDGKSTVWQAGADGAAVTAAVVLPGGGVWYRTTSYNQGLVNGIAETHTALDGSRALRTSSYGYGTVTVGDPGSPNHYTYLRLNSATWPCGSISRTYATNNLEMVETDDLFNTTTHYFNSRHQLTGIKHANGLTTTNLFDVNHFLAKRIDLEAQATNTYTFANGLVSGSVSPLGLSLTYDWDKLERLRRITFPDGTTVSNHYVLLDVVGRKDRLNQWTYASYNSMRQLESATDARNHTTLYSYCSCGALGSITDPLYNSTSFIRDYNGNVITNSSSDGFMTVYHRNILGQVTNVTSTAGLNLKYRYNHQGLVTNVSNPAGTVFAASFDECDRPQRLTDAQGNSVTNGFDTVGRLTFRYDAGGLVEQNTYTAQGLSQHLDALNHLTSFGYDPAGRLAAITNANLEIIQVRRDALGNVVSLTDGRNHTKGWRYDMFARQIAETNANGVLVRTNGYNANGLVTREWTAAKGLTQLSHDANGNVTTINYPLSTLNYSYDALNRLTQHTDAVGTHTRTYVGFGAFKSALASENGPWSSDTVDYGYTNHKLTSIGQGSWTENIAYDTSLRPYQFSVGANTFTYGFNGAGRQPHLLTMPQNTVGYDYDGLGELNSIQFKKGSTLLDTNGYVYDPTGLITNLTRMDGVTADYGYDPIGQLVSAQAHEASSALRLNENFGYAYDAAHNLAFRTNNTLTQAFTSDAANELASVVRDGTLTVVGSVTGALATVGVNGKPTAIYSDGTFATTSGLKLNPGFNIFVTVGTNTAGTLVLSTKATTRLPQTVNPSYDLNGNLTSDGWKAYDYDDANQLIRVTVTNGWRSEFVYDGLGRRRISKEYTWNSGWVKTNETRYVCDGMLPVQERDTNNNALVTYTRGLDLSGTRQGTGGIGGLLARTDSSGSAFYHNDAGGNITSMTDANGNAVARYLYDPFGNLLAKSGPMADANRYQFSSKEVHLPSGNYYYGFRFYEPNLQRWLNEDPIGEAGGMNLFGFVGNNPINYGDSDGLWFKEYGTLIGQGIYDFMMGDAAGGYDQNTQGAMRGRMLGGIDRNDNVLRDFSGGLAGFGVDQGTDYAAGLGAGKLIGAAVGASCKAASGIKNALKAADEVGALAAAEAKAGAKCVATTPANSTVGRMLGKLDQYPQVIDPRTGRHISFPSDVGSIVPQAQRVSWGAKERGEFVAEWYRRGYETPRGGWENYDIHHIKPREFGGGNGFWNLAPVERQTHQNLFNNFWRDFSGL